MRLLKISGYALVGLAVTVITAAILWFKGDGDVLTRGGIVAMVGMAFVLFRSHAMAAWIVVARLAPKRIDGRYIRNPEARIGRRESGQTHEGDWTVRLIENLSIEHDRAWRDAVPWLFVTGDDALVGRLLPQLVKQGWLVTPDIVLLWKARDVDGRISVPWLAALRKIRPARPLDAIVMLLDGSHDLSKQRHGIHPWNAMLVHVGDALRWHAPLYAMEVGIDTKYVGCDIPVIGAVLPSSSDAAVIKSKMIWLRDHLGDRSVTQMSVDPTNSFGASLSTHLDSRTQALSAWLASIGLRRKQLKVRGIFFTPEPTEESCVVADEMPVWRFIGDHARRHPGCAVGSRMSDLAFRMGIAGCVLASGAVLCAGISNVHDLQVTRQVLDDVDRAPDAAARIHALLALQQRIAFYEERQAHGAPIWTRLGFNRDSATLDLLWAPYGAANAVLLAAPVKQHLENQLRKPNAVPPADLYQNLKAYLMLSKPARADGVFLAPILTAILSERCTQSAGMTVGEGLDMGDRMTRFYVQRLPQHPSWRIDANTSVVTATQKSILSKHHASRSVDSVYRDMLDDVAKRYPDQTLASLTSGKDASGLFRTSVTVPGVFTRAAYEGAIAKAIDRAAAQAETPNDWVLGTDVSLSAKAGRIAATMQEGHTSQAAKADDSNANVESAFKAKLSARYFRDYADHWQMLMNSLQWESAPKMSVALDQLQRLTDPRHSPLITLMTSLAHQGSAGGATLLSLPSIDAVPSMPDVEAMSSLPIVDQQGGIADQQNSLQTLPMHTAFAPIFQLLGQPRANANANANVNSTHADNYADASLTRFLDKLTALRFKLQQAPASPTTAPDLRTLQTHRALFDGNDPALADAQSYAQWARASLGSEWAGMGQALFIRPIAQLGQQVSQSAQDTLNNSWRKSILATWQHAFAGRYPFVASHNDASIPELVRFIRADGGLIDHFVHTQLAGMLQRQGDQWVPSRSDAAAPTFDPAFLRALNTLQRIATQVQAQGGLHYRFDLQPQPTPGLTDTVLVLDGKQLHYFNQRQTWQAMSWPAPNPESPGTRLQWQTVNAGTNKNFEFHGRWGLLRMLEMAAIQPIDEATFKLTWQSIPDTRGLEAPVDDSLLPREAMQSPPPELTYPISYQMRTEVGRGPLELLALRGFEMPSRIFMDTVSPDQSEAL